MYTGIMTWSAMSCSLIGTPKTYRSTPVLNKPRWPLSGSKVLFRVAIKAEKVTVYGTSPCYGVSFRYINQKGIKVKRTKYR